MKLLTLILALVLVNSNAVAKLPDVTEFNTDSNTDADTKEANIVDMVPDEETEGYWILDEDGNEYYVKNGDQLAVKGKVRVRKSGRGCSASNGIASWYGPGFHGRKTANGETFNQNALTAAHRSLKFGSIVKVTYKGRSVNVRINDAGPYAKGRVIDLSKAAAKAIGLIGAGHGKVTLTVVRCGSK